MLENTKTSMFSLCPLWSVSPVCLWIQFEQRYTLFCYWIHCLFWINNEFSSKKRPKSLFGDTKYSLSMSLCSCIHDLKIQRLCNSQLKAAQRLCFHLSWGLWIILYTLPTHQNISAGLGRGTTFLMLSRTLYSRLRIVLVLKLYHIKPVT